MNLPKSIKNLRVDFSEYISKGRSKGITEIKNINPEIK